MATLFLFNEVILSSPIMGLIFHLAKANSNLLRMYKEKYLVSRHI